MTRDKTAQLLKQLNDLHSRIQDQLSLCDGAAPALTILDDVLKVCVDLVRANSDCCIGVRRDGTYYIETFASDRR